APVALAAPVVPAAPEEPPPPPAATAVAAAQHADAAEDGRFDVICFPIIDWGFRFQRPQQTMSRFAAAGHRVFYVAQHFRPDGEPYRLHRITERVWEVSLRGPDRNVYTGALDAADVDLLFESLDSLRREESLGATVSVVQLPFWSPIARRLKKGHAWPVVYDCMDHHAGFSNTAEQMLSEEGELFSSSDLVVVSSGLLQREAAKRSRNVQLVRNGCDYEHFAKVPAGKKRGPRPVIGYYGAIADWFDSDLLADLAERRPDWDFLLVGSTASADLSRLSKLPHVTFTGEKPYQEIPDWLARFDVAVIPFKRIPLTEATNPVKAYEILAGGKAVVSVPIPEMVPLAPLARLASTPQEFEKEITAALAERDPALVARRRAFARQNTWERRFADLAPAVEKTFPKASLIVVTYGNLELTRLCIESIYRTVEWPSFEVIVVDNGSTDGTPEYLESAKKIYPDLTVRLNADNLGFAAANNIGLRLATGEYLAFLNNDTVSCRGWLSALIRHLSRDPSIGIIGPSTNAIGNEGMVAVGYERLEEMPGWAERFTREHDGEVFDIKMLAMFCVAIRRGVFEEVGFLDERFGIGMFEDDDYAVRVREAGYRVVCARDAFIHHFMKASFKKLAADEYQRLFERNKRLFEEKWQSAWSPHQYATDAGPHAEGTEPARAARSAR
ncbi:MAG TPA: glycosyltransferase, partial [Thermoanaerobaculia bacterium]|nr:glycosyltransferase [Thermoanaerobaculia bacterium]